jgi:hypothetical protein
MMPTCENCGAPFAVDDARREYESHDEWNWTYEEEFPEHSVCGSCASNDTLENVGAGRAHLFSLETGFPPEDMPDDWTASS